MEALGLIEVRGFLGAISAADIALKSANVSLISTTKTGGGLQTIMLKGDVAAVKAAVEAGANVAEQLGCLLSSHVISRVDLMTAEMINMLDSVEQNVEQVIPVSSVDSSYTKIASDSKVSSEKIGADEKAELLTQTVSGNKANPIAEANAEETKDKLKKMSVVALRKMAYEISPAGIKRGQIKFANKATLLEVLTNELTKKGGDK